jgi:transcription initiation factor TFIIH subunit 4
MQLGQVSSELLQVTRSNVQDYSASQSFPHASSTLDELEHYGFIYKRDPNPDDSSKSDQFFPTHLATSLTSGTASTVESGDEKKFLILETNYKIYAYTGKAPLLQVLCPADTSANELEIAILNLFVNIKIRYQNLVVGKLDRQHVKAAMEKGISANQVSFISSFRGINKLM